MPDLMTLLKRHALSDNVALRSAEQKLTYRALWMRVDDAVAWLNSRSETRIAIALENSFDWIIWDLACLRAAKVLIPIPPFFSVEQQQNVLHDSAAQLLIGMQIDTGLREAATAERLSVAADFPVIFKLSTNKLQARLPDGTQKITYTSGSTGQPKGVCLSADGIATVVSSLLDRLPNQLHSRHLVVMPLAVLLENIAGVYVTLALGAEVVVLPSRSIGLMGASDLNVEQFINCLKQYQISTLVIPPALLEVICAGVEYFGLSAHQFEFIAVGGARLAAAQEQRAMDLGLPIVVGYGLSECASVVALNDISKQRPLGSVGTLLPHVSGQIRSGELFIRSPLMLGYLGDEALAAEWLATGDLAHFDASGHLYIDGRKKNIIVTPYGRNVDPEWLETELLTNSLISQVCVSGDESHPLRALIVSSAERNEIERAVQGVNMKLPDYAQIKDIELISTPFTVANQQLTGTGRLRRQAILSRYPFSMSSLEY